VRQNVQGDTSLFGLSVRVFEALIEDGQLDPAELMELPILAIADHQ